MMSEKTPNMNVTSGKSLLAITPNKTINNDINKPEHIASIKSISSISIVTLGKYQDREHFFQCRFKGGDGRVVGHLTEDASHDSLGAVRVYAQISSALIIV